MIVPLYPTLMSVAFIPGVSVQERHGSDGGGPEKATKIIRGKGWLASEDRLRQLWLFSVEKAPERPFCSLPVLVGACKRWEQTSNRACSYRTRGDGFKGGSI